MKPAANHPNRKARPPASGRKQEWLAWIKKLRRKKKPNPPEKPQASEKELLAAPERLYTFYENAPAGFMRFNAKGIILNCNAYGANLIGMAPEQLKLWKIPLHTFLTSESQPVFQRHIEAVLADGVEKRDELHIQGGQGREAFVSISSLAERDPENSEMYCVSVLEDLTALSLLTRDNAMLTRELKRLRLAMEASQDGLWDWNLVSGEIYFSPQWAAMLGFKPEEIAPHEKTLFSLLHPEDKPRVMSQLQRHLEGGASIYEAEFRIKAKDGNWHWHFAHGKVFSRDAKGKALRVIGTQRDVTEKKTAEEETMRAQLAIKAAEAGDQAKSRFMAAMSHEMRTPLNGVIGFASLLQQCPMDAEMAEYAENIHASAHHLLDLVDNILDLTRIEMGTLELDNEPFSIREAALGVVQKLRQEAENKNVALEAKIDDEIPEIVYGDSFRFHQVLRNLLENALKFTRKGSVSLDLKSLYLPSAAAYEITGTVKDTGEGIRPERIDLLFKPFGRKETGEVIDEEGAGLGLALSHRLCQLMGGNISAESSAGCGSTFYFSIKANAELEKTGGGTWEDIETSRFHERYPLRILAAEDNKVNRVVTRSLLGKLGYTPDFAEDGAEVLRLLNRLHYDVLLMDVQMPVMDGVEATRLIRAGETGEKNRDIPIVAVTAFALERDNQRCLDAGMNGFLTKPLKMEQIKKVLAAARDKTLQPS